MCACAHTHTVLTIPSVVDTTHTLPGCQMFAVHSADSSSSPFIGKSGDNTLGPVDHMLIYA